MNKALLLLLVTLVLSQSDGVLLPSPDTNEQFHDSQSADWDSLESPHPVVSLKGYDLNAQPYRKRSVTNDAFTRRSALDKNFMRFGRADDTLQKACEWDHSNGELSFYRFGRGAKDSFIRFGKAGENFIRFGRGGGKDGFLRFGKGRPDNFFRAGKSLRENFIRFGKSDKNFLNVDRKKSDEDYQDFVSSEEFSQRSGKPSRMQENFMRFGRSGKNGTNFLRFGKSEDAEADGADEGDQDSNAAKGVKRKRRDARGGFPGKGSTGFFQTPPNNFPRKMYPVLESSWQKLENFRNSRLTPFFPVFSNSAKSLDLYNSESKRNQGRSNFIRFG